MLASPSSFFSLCFRLFCKVYAISPNLMILSELANFSGSFLFSLFADGASIVRFWLLAVRIWCELLAKTAGDKFLQTAEHYNYA